MARDIDPADGDAAYVRALEAELAEVKRERDEAQKAQLLAAEVALREAKDLIARLSAHVAPAFIEDRVAAGRLIERLAALTPPALQSDTGTVD